MPVGIQNENHLRMEFSPLSSLLTLGPQPVIKALSFPPETDRFLKGRHLPGSNQANAPLGDPIAFFIALQSISREKGFWRN
jgi:hypothetical protein